MADLTSEQFEAAKARGLARFRGPRAESARYDAGRNRVVIRMVQGFELGLMPADVEGLHDAPIEALREVEVDALGLAVRFPRLDVDLYVPALIEGVLGSPSWMANWEMRLLRKRRGRIGAAPSRAAE